MKRTIALLASGLLALSLAACGGQAQQTGAEAGQAEATDAEDFEFDFDDDEEFVLPPIPDDVTGGKPWIDSVVVGNVTESTVTSPADDLYLYVNKDWITSATIPAGRMTTDSDVFAEGRASVVEILTGDTLTEHDARQAQLLFDAFCDTDARKAAGVEPVRQVIDDIRSFSSIDEVSAFLLDTERSAGVPSLVTVTNKRDSSAHRWKTEVRLSTPTFGRTVGTMGMDAANIDPESVFYTTRLALVSDVLTRLGYTEEEAKTAFEGRLELERALLQAADEATGEQDETQPLTIDQLDGLAGSFPLRALAEARGYGQAEGFTVNDAADLYAAGTVYNDEHLDALRDYLICGYVLEAGAWLDTEAFDAWRDVYDDGGNSVSLTMPERNRSIAETAVNLEAVMAPTLVGRAYVEGGNLEHTKEFMQNLCEVARDTHKQLVNDCTWLSDTSKQRLCQKLDAMTMNVVYPDAWEDYSGLDLDGLGYFDACRAIWLNDVERNAALTNTEIDDRLWDKPSLIEGGASYDLDNNSFHVDACVCAGDLARYEAGETTIAGFLGSAAGYGCFHEIGHALDTGNIYLDEQSNYVEESLLEPADLEEYERRVTKLADYLDSISIWEGQQVQGDVCVNEALAEICGMQARLAYAAKQEGFDYQEFFEQRARLNPTLGTPEFELMWILGADYHPSCFLDTNVTVQQFEEFMQAYGVKEGDGMWLAPEDRIVLW